MFAVSVLLFLAQVADVPPRASVIEASVLAALLAAPMHAITASALSACNRHSRTATFIPLALQCRAALLRFALTMGELDGYSDRLSHARASDDALLAPPDRHWIRDGVLQRLLRARRDALALPLKFVQNLTLNSI